ncbi:MAG: hypothetical protein ACRDVG_08550 [Jatrophihabitantaceae bacterium]
MDDRPRPHRPAKYADLTGFIDAATADGAQGADAMSPSARAEIAAATAAVLVQTGRAAGPPDDDRFVALVDRVGIDTLAELWRDSEPVSLPGALWALYLLRQWFHSSAEHVRLLWRHGSPLAPADAVVAGVAEPGDASSLRAAADAILNGVYRGDVAVSLERAAAVFRVMAEGRRDVCDSMSAGSDEHTAEQALADRNERVATDLAAAAQCWRAGTLH